MKLREFFCKNVRLVDVDGKEWIGYVRTFVPAIDTDDDMDWIGLKVGSDLIEFHENEIKEISII